MKMNMRWSRFRIFRYTTLLFLSLTFVLLYTRNAYFRGKVILRFMMLTGYLGMPTSSSSGSDDIEKFMHRTRMNFYHEEPMNFMLHSNHSVKYFKNTTQYRTWFQGKLASKTDHIYLTDLKVLAIQGLYKRTCGTIDRSSVTDNEENQHAIRGELVPAVGSSNLKLIQLLLEDQGLMDVSADALNGLGTLRLISLIGNCLRTLPNGLFSSTTNLEVLDLRYNQLQHINMQSLNQLHMLDLSNNPLTSMNNMRLGRNRDGAVFVLKDTNIQYIQYCYEELPTRDVNLQNKFERSKFATIYIGTSHTVSCSCGILGLDDLIRGNKCISSTADWFRLRMCQEETNLVAKFKC